MSETSSSGRWGTTSRSTIILLVLLVVFLVIPLTGLLGRFEVGLLIDMMVLALFATSFNLVWGYTGMLSFGHAAYFGVAAYTVAIVFNDMFAGIPAVFNSFVLTMLLGVVVATVFAAVFGAFCVQRGEFYFAMLTLAFNMLLYGVARTADNISGGANGLTVSIRTVDLGVVSFNPLDAGQYYYFTLVLFVASLLVIWRIVNSPYGELLKAIRENPERVQFVGLRVKYYQWSAFVLSGAFAGLAGTLAVVREFLVSPSVLHWSASADPVFAALIGGPSVFLGPTLGAVILIWLEVILTNITQHWLIGLGVILIPLVLYAPRGILGTLAGRSSEEYLEFLGGTRNRLGGATDEEPVSDLEQGGEQ